MPPAASHRPGLIAIPLVAVCIICAFAPDGVAAGLAFDRDAILAGEIWRLWTGHIVHFSAQHAALDIAALLLVSIIAERELGSEAMALALLIGSPLISIGLLVVAPDMTLYMGASGLSTFIGVVAGALLWRKIPRLRGILVLIGVAVIAKTFGDTMGLSHELSSMPLGVRVAWQAHVLGGFLGAVCAGWFSFPATVNSPHYLHYAKGNRQTSSAKVVPKP